MKSVFPFLVTILLAACAPASQRRVGAVLDDVESYIEGQTISLWPVFADEYHIICRGKTSEELWLLSRSPSHPA